MMLSCTNSAPTASRPRPDQLCAIRAEDPVPQGERSIAAVTVEHGVAGVRAGVARRAAPLDVGDAVDAGVLRDGPGATAAWAACAHGGAPADQVGWRWLSSRPGQPGCGSMMA